MANLRRHVGRPAYSDIGDCMRANLLFERAVPGCDRVLGPDHPHTIALRGSRSRLCGEPT